MISFELYARSLFYQKAILFSSKLSFWFFFQFVELFVLDFVHLGKFFQLAFGLVDMFFYSVDLFVHILNPWHHRQKARRLVYLVNF